MVEPLQIRRAAAAGHRVTDVPAAIDGAARVGVTARRHGEPAPDRVARAALGATSPAGTAGARAP